MEEGCERPAEEEGGSVSPSFSSFLTEKSLQPLISLIDAETQEIDIDTMDKMLPLVPHNGTCMFFIGLESVCQMDRAVILFRQPQDIEDGLVNLLRRLFLFFSEEIKNSVFQMEECMAPIPGFPQPFQKSFHTALGY